MMLSIIIPTFNRRDLIKYTIDSLAQNLHPGIEFEVIVIDDSSDDDTLEFISQNYPWVTRLANSGKGASSARNAGLKMAKGKYILYLDSDDLVGANYFNQKIQLLEKSPEIDACYGEYEYFESDAAFYNEDIIFKIKYPLIQSSANSKEHLVNYLSGYFMPPNTIIWRKKFLERIGGHDNKLSINQDVELYIRALLNDLKIIAVKDNTYVYVRSHSIDIRVGTPGNSDSKYLEILEIRKRIIAIMREKKITDQYIWHSLSIYLFNKWREIRLLKPELANNFLSIAKEVYWPVQIQGGILLQILSKIFGPVTAVKIKDLIKKI